MASTFLGLQGHRFLSAQSLRLSLDIVCLWNCISLQVRPKWHPIPYIGLWLRVVHYGPGEKNKSGHSIGNKGAIWGVTRSMKMNVDRFRGDHTRVVLTVTFYPLKSRLDIYIHTHKGMWTPLQISGFSYFSHTCCGQVYKIEHTAMQSP